MLSQFGINLQFTNIARLSCEGKVTAARSLSSLSLLKCAYRSFLEKIQKRNIGIAEDFINITSNFEEAKLFYDLFANDSLLDDKGQAKVILPIKDSEAEVKENIIRQTIKKLASYPTYHGILLDTIITDIFIMPSGVARAGSTSQAIGIIWANPKTTYDSFDIVEILVHELTHHTMFIDEACHKHYNYNLIIDKSNWARSAILNEYRPFDKVLHSIVVSMEIILLRIQCQQHIVNCRVHPSTTIMREQLRDSIDSIEEVVVREPNIIYDRVLEILDNVKRLLIDYKL